MMFRRNHPAAEVPVPTQADVQRLLLQAAEITQEIKEITRELESAKAEVVSAKYAEKDQLNHTITLLEGKLAHLDARLATKKAEIERAEKAIKLPGLRQQSAEAERLLLLRRPIVAEVDRANRALAAALANLNEVDEKIYGATAGRDRDTHWRMTDDWHLTNRRVRMAASLPQAWPEWIRRKFSSGAGRMFPDRRSVAEVEAVVEASLRQHLKSELESLEGEVSNVSSATAKQ